MKRALVLSAVVAMISFAPQQSLAADADDVCRQEYLSCVDSSNQCRAGFDVQALQCKRQIRAKSQECEEWHRTNRPGVDPEAACSAISMQREQCTAGRANACPTANACLAAVERCQRGGSTARAVKPVPAPASTPEPSVGPAPIPASGQARPRVWG
jgi:hypothetical protein